ncbi:MAG TPA: hypothetical protein VM326_00560 [Sphingomicrobium sp.]|jgi:hypothetical protein|nr:hypothetical protein [Sphingomicrobium sp.]
MSRILIALALIAAPTSTAVAQTMSAETFYKRAQALEKKGAMAMLSRGEIKALMTEAQAAAKRAREQRLATVKAGGKPRSCPPEGSRMGSDEFMQRLGAIPAAERSQIDMTEATIRILAAKYPC